MSCIGVLIFCCNTWPPLSSLSCQEGLKSQLVGEATIHGGKSHKQGLQTLGIEGHIGNRTVFGGSGAAPFDPWPPCDFLIVPGSEVPACGESAWAPL